MTNSPQVTRKDDMGKSTFDTTAGRRGISRGTEIEAARDRNCLVSIVFVILIILSG